MESSPLRKALPRGVLRVFLRTPIWLFRLRLGRLLSDRFLMITHIGRKSGLPRQTVLEVVQHDPSAGTYTVASGWGERADWYRNIQQTPQVLLDTAYGRCQAIAQRLPVPTATEALADYARRHPAAFRQLTRFMTAGELQGAEGDPQLPAERIPLIVLRPLGD